MSKFSIALTTTPLIKTSMELKVSKSMSDLSPFSFLARFVSEISSEKVVGFCARPPFLSCLVNLSNLSK